jgi:choline monooxygenase
MTPALREKLLQFNPDLPLEKASTIPSLWYSDPEIYQAECRSVFNTTWQVGCRLDQLAEPGCYVTTNIAGEPILLVRDADGVLRAFYNVCRHRAALVMNEPCGQASRFRCRYHGWTYDLAGRLRGTPEFEGVADFHREENGLVELEVATWGPLLWFRARQGETTGPSLADFLAPLPEKTVSLGLDSLRFVEQRSYDLACNWKVFVDNYLDGGYHVNTVHPGLAGVLDYSRYRTEIAGWTSVQSSPLRPAGSHEESAATARVRSGEAAWYWWVFPNFMMNIYEGVMDTNLVLPLGPNGCRVIFDFYFGRTEGPEVRQFIAESISVGHQIQLEDMAICEEVQKGLASRSYGTGRFSVRREAAGYHFHCLLAHWLQAGASIQDG